MLTVLEQRGYWKWEVSNKVKLLLRDNPLPIIWFGIAHIWQLLCAHMKTEGKWICVSAHWKHLHLSYLIYRYSVSVCPRWTVMFHEVGGVKSLLLKTFKYCSQQRIAWHSPGIFRPNHSGVLSSNPQQVTSWHQVFLQSMQLLKETKTLLSSLETLSLFGHKIWTPAKSNCDKTKAPSVSKKH